MTQSTVAAALASLEDGGFVVVVDDGDPTRGGALVVAAEHVNQENIAFMVRHTSGLITVPMQGHDLDRLGLATAATGPVDAFTLSVDAVDGTTTGVSSGDRARTIRTLIDAGSVPADLARPGHVFPRRYEPGGVLVRPEVGEAAVDLARMAGLTSAGALSHIVNDDGSLATPLDLEDFVESFGIALLTIGELVDHRWRTEAVVTHEVEADLPTDAGVFRAHGFRSSLDGSEHIALVFGSVTGRTGVLTRVHSECLTGDVFGSARCDCGMQLDEAMRLIVAAGAGVIVYDRRHEGRGIGLLQKLKAYRLQDTGLDTVEANLTLGHPADARHYGIDAQILSSLKIDSIRLLTNNPDKIDQLSRLGITVVERVPLEVAVSRHNADYLDAKAKKMGHYLNGNVDD